MVHNVASALDHLWDIGLEHLSDYVDEVGHPWIAKGHRCDDGFDLALWIDVLAQRWVDGQLTEAQREALTAIPGWTVMMDLAGVGPVPDGRIAVG